jgi:hypothetical protein
MWKRKAYEEETIRAARSLFVFDVCNFCEAQLHSSLGHQALLFLLPMQVYQAQP